MPVVMWGVYDAGDVLKELPRLKHLGFTHCLGFSADDAHIFEAGQPTTAATSYYTRPGSIGQSSRPKIADAGEVVTAV